MPVRIPSAKYSTTGREFYEPIGKLDCAPIASVQHGVFSIHLSLFTDNEVQTFYRVYVCKESVPFGHKDKYPVDYRFSDLELDAIPEYEGKKAQEIHRMVTGRR